MLKLIKKLIKKIIGDNEVKYYKEEYYCGCPKEHRGEMFTVLRNGALWTQIVDDQNGHESWGLGGMIFLSRETAEEFVESAEENEEADKEEKAVYKIVKLRI